MIRFLVLPALAFALLGAAPPAPTASPETFGISVASQPEPGILTAAQPTAEQLADLGRAGYKTVLDLRMPEESRPFAEPAAVAQAGMAYRNIPFTTATLDDAAIDRFLASLREAERPVVIHCASSNRVGAMYYAHLVLEKGVAPAEALERAKAAGLRQPELTARIQELVAARSKKE